MKCQLFSALIFGIKFVKYPASSAYFCNMYWITTFKMIENRPIYWISEFSYPLKGASASAQVIWYRSGPVLKTKSINQENKPENVSTFALFCFPSPLPEHFDLDLSYSTQQEIFYYFITMTPYCIAPSLRNTLSSPAAANCLQDFCHIHHQSNDGAEPQHHRACFSGYC